MYEKKLLIDTPISTVLHNEEHKMKRGEWEEREWEMVYRPIDESTDLLQGGPPPPVTAELGAPVGARNKSNLKK